MEEFEPIRDFFQRRQAKKLNERASTVQLVTERAAAYRGHFVFPGIDTVAGIEVDGQCVGYVDYGINPLGDWVYINRVDIEDIDVGEWSPRDVVALAHASGALGTYS